MYIQHICTRVKDTSYIHIYTTDGVIIPNGFRRRRVRDDGVDIIQYYYNYRVKS